MTAPPTPEMLNAITLKGFKSIRALENFELTSLNVLIGGNGAGKSNFIDFFRMLRAMMALPLPDLPRASLKAYIADGGGSDAFLFNGPKATSAIEAMALFGPIGYRFTLSPTAEEDFLINDEAALPGEGATVWRELGSGHASPELLRQAADAEVDKDAASLVHAAIASFKIYHFHDTSKTAPMRRSEAIDDHRYLRFNAANIAPFLLFMKKTRPDAYQRIIETVRLVAPFFDDFILDPNPSERVRLLWRQKGSDFPLRPSHLSDGTLRFICLATALLQPDLPSTIIIDEPELGLHPFAIDILSELVVSASRKTQVIISTQSAALVDCFRPEDIIVVERKDGASVFQRLDARELSHWLEDYSLGELWRKNVIAGGPSHE